MKETSYAKKRLFSEFNLLTVSDIFSCELTSKNQKKLSLHTFICLSSSLWGSSTPTIYIMLYVTITY